MPHSLLVAVFPASSAAAAGARAVHAAGVTRDQISVVARTHDEEGALAAQMDASPGADIEDSRTAAILGELSGQVLAAVAVLLPGVGSIVAAGPLSAELAEAAGHVAGGVASTLSSAGIPDERAAAIQQAVEEGSVLLGIHLTSGDPVRVREALLGAGATTVETGRWPD